MRNYIRARMREVSRSCHGGRKADYPGPHERKFDDKRRRRKVSVHIGVFSGIGRHFHVSMNEESNPILDLTDPDKPAWRSFWDDDPEHKGMILHDSFNTYAEAEAYVKRMQKKHFPKKTHKLMDHIEHREWVYREGD